MVRDLRLWYVELNGERAIGWPLVIRRIGDVIGFEDSHLHIFALGRAGRAHRIECNRQDASHPFVVNARIGFIRCVSAGCVGGLERGIGNTTTPFQPALSLCRVRREPVHTRAKKGPESTARTIVARKPLLLDRLGEEILRQVLGVRSFDVPPKLEQRGDGAPVRPHEHIGGGASRQIIACAEGLEHRMSCRRKRPPNGDVEGHRRILQECVQF